MMGRPPDRGGEATRVLRHYDQIGLLVPARVVPSNGYRFYTAEQLAKGFPFRPDLVKIAYFETAADLARFQRDPRHEHIEQRAYPSGVRQSIRVLGPALPHDALSTE